MNLKIKMLCMLMIISIYSIQVFGTTTAQVSYSKEIHLTGDEQYKMFKVPYEVYNKGIETLRIVDNNGNTIPYFLHNHKPTNAKSIISNNTTLINTFIKDNDLYFDFIANNTEDNTDILTNNFVFSTNKNIYTKQLLVYGSYDGNTWDYIRTDYIYCNYENPKENIKLNEVVKYEYFRVQVLDCVDDFTINSLTLVNEAMLFGTDYFIQSFDVEDYEIIELKDISEIIIPNEKIKNLKINTIDLTIATDTFKRDVSSNIFINSEEAVYRYYNNSKLIEKTNIIIDYLYNSDDDLSIIIKNYDDKPLDIRNIKLNYYFDYVVFKSEPNKSYNITFGDKTLNSPIYDVERYKEGILEKSIDLVKLSENTTSLSSDSLDFKKSEDIFTKDSYNMFFIVISIIVTFLLIINLKKHNDS